MPKKRRLLSDWETEFWQKIRRKEKQKKETESLMRNSFFVGLGVRQAKLTAFGGI